MSEWEKEFEKNLTILEIHARTHKPVKHITNGEKYETQLLYEILTGIRKILNKIKNGTLVELPCKVGDIVYVVSRYYAGDWEVYKCKIDNLTIYGKNTFISCDANTAIFGKINFGLNVSEIGKTVFFTKEEAEQKLKGGVE